MDSSKGNERINDEGEVEINVKTVDYRKPAEEEEPPHKEKVTITHLIHDDNNGGAAANAAAEKPQPVNEAGKQ